MAELTGEQISTLVVEAVLHAQAKRRKEDVEHICFCSDPLAKADHDKAHEALNRLCHFLDRVESTKWAFALAVLTVIAGASALAVWEGVKALLKK